MSSKTRSYLRWSVDIVPEYLTLMSVVNTKLCIKEWFDIFGTMLVHFSAERSED